MLIIKGHELIRNAPLIKLKRKFSSKATSSITKGELQMTTRRKFVSGCLAASLTPSFAFAAANDNASDFDMKQYVKELNELVSIDSKSGTVSGRHRPANRFEAFF